MLRRIHVPALRIGDIRLDSSEAHHARDVLRLRSGAPIEVFDDSGKTADAVLVGEGIGDLAVRIEQVREPTHRAQWTIAAAIPKGERADWMVEKLSELGTAKFIPLAAERSVVLPEGKNKPQRWTRIATESAKQSRRQGVMEIAPLTSVADVIALLRPPHEPIDAWYLSTASGALPINKALQQRKHDSLLLVIGPEGGWTNSEMDLFQAAGMLDVSLTHTILRIETAAVAAAAVVASCDARVGS